ncbi:MAG: chemotaxis protein CheX [Lachnospiraceae bacterium]|nr:chemotaxis protein CheX [Lachnospiraceae bacterium]
MFAQFFGNFLLGKDAVTPEQLAKAIAQTQSTHVKLGTIAMQKGYMTAAEVDEVCFMQTREDKRFGEIAVERNYLFEDQLEDLLETQNSNYLLLGQALVDLGYLTNEELESHLIEYQAENDLGSLSAGDESDDAVERLVENFLEDADGEIPDHAVIYIKLVFNSLVRFVGQDFTPLAPIEVDSYEAHCCVTQRIGGPIHITASLDMDEDVAIEFASRYADMEFDSFDEYAEASLEDFLNLHNGLFTVNMSNSRAMELSLEPPYHEDETEITFRGKCYVIPVIYPFGTVYVLVEI